MLPLLFCGFPVLIAVRIGPDLPYLPYFVALTFWTLFGAIFHWRHGNLLFPCLQWIYELVAILTNGLPFLLHMRMARPETARGQSEPVTVPIRDWITALETVLPEHVLAVCDSHYLLNASIKLLDESQRVKYLLAATSTKCPYIELLADVVSRPGEWAGMYNTLTHQSLVYHWSSDSHRGKKASLSNAYERKAKMQKVDVVPLSDDYASMLGRADNFNQRLCDCTWPFKKGGRSYPDDNGFQSNFSFSAILQNVFNVWMNATNALDKDCDFATHCRMLADEIYSHSLTLND